jgi:hypothetical protein
MRPGSDELKSVLADGSFTKRLLVDAFNGADRTLYDIGNDNWELKWDREGNLKSAGFIRLVHSTPDGTSISPTAISDPLAPYGQEVNVLLEVLAGSFAETVQIGHYRIAAVPLAQDEHGVFLGQQIVTSSLVDLTIEDRLSRLARRGFRSEENPASTSAWAELARISGMQVLASVADVTLPTDLVYPAVKGGRLAAVKTIAGLLGGDEYTTPDGALSVVPATPGSPVGALVLGEEGTIVGDDGGMDSTEVYNVVVGQFEDDERIPIVKIWTADDELSPEVIPENTYYHRNSAIKTDVAAQAEVEAVGAIVSRPAKRILVQCILNPLIEIGDVLEVGRRDGSTLLGQVVRYRYGSANLMTVEMDVV